MFYTAEIATVNGEETASLFKWGSIDEARKRLHTQMSYHSILSSNTHSIRSVLKYNNQE